MKIPHLRWMMVSLIFLATVINYIDRQTVSVLKTSISTDLGLSNADYASIRNSLNIPAVVANACATAAPDQTTIENTKPRRVPMRS